MSPGAQRNLVRAAGALLGVGLALTLLAVSRPGAAVAPAPASVRFLLAPVGELEISPAPPRPALAARGLRPGGPRASGQFELRNQTGEELVVRLGAATDSSSLDGLVKVEIRAGDRLLTETTLQGLGLHPAKLRLASGQRARLRLAAWLPVDVLTGYEAAQVEVTLIPTAHTVGA